MKGSVVHKNVKSVSGTNGNNSDLSRLFGVKRVLHGKRPRFLRQDAHKKSRLSQVWREPKGIQSKVKKAIKGHRLMVKVGWGSPSAIRGVLRSGVRPVLVSSVSEAGSVKPGSIIILSSTLGLKSLVSIVKISRDNNFSILNIPKNFDSVVKSRLDSRKGDRKLDTGNRKPESGALDSKVESQSSVSSLQSSVHSKQETVNSKQETVNGEPVTGGRKPLSGGDHK